MAGLTCPNGHCMDEGYFECPACGAYRPSAHDPNALIKNGRVVGVRNDFRLFGRAPKSVSEAELMRGLMDDLDA